MVEIIKVDFLSEINNDVLRERAERARCCRSLEFIAKCNGIECGLLSYEDWSSRAEGIIYEIFVLVPFRGDGVGAILLSHAESLARQLGCRCISLKPYALDAHTNQDQLTSWYLGKGYTKVSSDQEFIEKRLVD
jgi:GNAT superfamily N-acetyltransferase